MDSSTWYLAAPWGLLWKRNILRQKRERSLLRNCIAMCERNSQSYTFLSSHHFANTVFWKSAMGYFLVQWSLQWQRKYTQMKTRKNFLRHFLMMCEFIPQSSTYVSCSRTLSLSLRNLRWVSLDRLEAYAEKENIISSKRERSFLRIFFVISEFTSQSYSLVLRKQFLTLFSWSLQSDLWEPIRAYGEKGNIPR